MVAIGGGHGLAQSLHAIRTYARSIVAVVSVADDGGSSGRLRELLSIPAPGDIRRCMSALAPGASALAAALEHRFTEGELAGHAFGNLLIAALAATTGDFVRGVEVASASLELVGRVLPATSEPVVLKAASASGDLIGQAEISRSEALAMVSLVPSDPTSPEAVGALLLAADQVVIGPGSLFTSILAACIVPAVREALQATAAQRVYVANLKQQVGETAGLDVAAHLRALFSHGVAIDAVLADPARIELGELDQSVRLVSAPLAGPSGIEHDPALLGVRLRALWSERACGSHPE